MAPDTDPVLAPEIVEHPDDFVVLTGYPFGPAPEPSLTEPRERWASIPYNSLGPPLPPDLCRYCWGVAYVWLGNVWGLRHRGGTMSYCDCGCHDFEVWMA